MTFSFNLIVIACIAVVGLILAWKSSSSRSAKEPRSLPHWIPFFGHAFSFARDKRAFFITADKWNSGSPFSILLGGKKHYIFSDPIDCNAIHRSEKTLSFKGAARYIYIAIWGFSPKDADKMLELKPEWLQIDKHWMLGAENNMIMTNIYNNKLDERMQDLDAQVKNSDTRAIVLDGFEVVMDTLGLATCMMFYGDETVKNYMSMMYDVRVMVRDGFWGMLFHVPRWLWKFRPSYEARDRLVGSYASLVRNIDMRTDASEYVRERTKYLTAHGISPEAQGADLLRINFASLLNPIPIAYLAILHLLAEPELANDVRQELTDAGYQNLTPSELTTIIPSSVPLLRSVWHETLRLHNNSLMVREVLAPTTLPGTRTWELQKGNFVSFVGGLLHHNATLHPNPHEFHPRRFMERSLGGEGESYSKTTKPFGGGSTHCPGRVFAEKQMIGLVASMLMRYNIRVTNDKWSIPTVSEFDDITKKPAIFWEISQRKVVT